MSKPKPGKREPFITAEQYRQAVEAAEVLRKADRHEEADEMMGVAVELRRMERDAHLVATEYGRYPEGAEITEGEGN